MMSIDTATDDGVSDFLKRIKELDAKKNAEDELRTRQLEEQIAAGRRRRRALREDRARSISPEKKFSRSNLKSITTSNSPLPTPPLKPANLTYVKNNSTTSSTLGEERSISSYFHEISVLDKDKNTQRQSSVNTDFSSGTASSNSSYGSRSSFSTSDKNLDSITTTPNNNKSIKSTNILGDVDLVSDDSNTVTTKNKLENINKTIENLMGTPKTLSLETIPVTQTQPRSFKEVSKRVTSGSLSGNKIEDNISSAKVNRKSSDNSRKSNNIASSHLGRKQTQQPPQQVESTPKKIDTPTIKKSERLHTLRTTVPSNNFISPSRITYSTSTFRNNNSSDASTRPTGPVYGLNRNFPNKPELENINNDKENAENKFVSSDLEQKLKYQIPVRQSSEFNSQSNLDRSDPVNNIRVSPIVSANRSRGNSGSSGNGLSYSSPLTRSPPRPKSPERPSFIQSAMKKNSGSTFQPLINRIGEIKAPSPDRLSMSTIGKTGTPPLLRQSFSTLGEKKLDAGKESPAAGSGLMRQSFSTLGEKEPIFKEEQRDTSVLRNTQGDKNVTIITEQRNSMSNSFSNYSSPSTTGSSTDFIRSDSRRWSPTKQTSWLESALKRSPTSNSASKLNRFNSTGNSPVGLNNLSSSMGSNKGLGKLDESTTLDNNDRFGRSLSSLPYRSKFGNSIKALSSLELSSPNNNIKPKPSLESIKLKKPVIPPKPSFYSSMNNTVDALPILPTRKLQRETSRTKTTTSTNNNRMQAVKLPFAPQIEKELEAQRFSIPEKSSEPTLTHMNKSRARGPKRRLPSSIQGTGASTKILNSFEPSFSKKEIKSKPSLESVVLKKPILPPKPMLPPKPSLYYGSNHSSFDHSVRRQFS